MSTVTPAPASSVVDDLMNPSDVRNDLVVLLGLIGVVAAAVAPTWHMPVIADAVLGAVSGLLALGVRIAHTIVRGGLTKAALESDAANLKSQVPTLEGYLNVLKPFVENEFPQLKNVITQAANDAAEAKTVATAAQTQLAALPPDQSAEVTALLTRLRAALGVVDPAPVAPVAPVVAPEPAPPAV